MTIRYLLVEMLLAFLGPRHARKNRGMLMAFKYQLRSLNGVHRVSPDVPVMHIRLVNTFSVL